MKTAKAPKLHWSLRESSHRLIESLAPTIQIALGATAAYLVTRYGLGHEIPLLAVTACISSLGFSRDARPRRIAATAAGMVTGIALSETMLNLLGVGIWQMTVILLLVLLAARFLTSNAAFAIAAGTQAMLVYLLPAPAGGPYMRSIDGMIGGLTALVVTALIPRDPRGLAKKDAEKLFDIFLDSVSLLRHALTRSDLRAADATLLQVRKTQPLVDNWRMSLDSAIAIARISPFLRKYRDELRGQLRLMRGMDLATRNLRVIVRRIDFLLRDGEPRPYLADLMDQIEAAVRTLRSTLDQPELLDRAQEELVQITHQLDPKRFGIADQLREASVLLLLRPMLVDLMCAAGMSEEDARAELPTV